MKKILLALLLFCTLAQAKTTPSVLLYDLDEHRTIYSENPQLQRPLASITKLMTAMVSLDHDQSLQRPLPTARRRLVTRYHAFGLLLIRSDNSMAELISQDYPGGRAAFIAAMNHKARSLGMLHTTFEDPSGLSSNNRSTAEDINRMLQAAQGYRVIAEISPRAQHTIEVRNNKRRHQQVLRNTNFNLLYEFDGSRVSKTGFTSAAGRCIAMIIEHQGRLYSVVVLGTATPQQRQRTVEDLMYRKTREI